MNNHVKHMKYSGMHASATQYHATYSAISLCSHNIVMLFMAIPEGDSERTIKFTSSILEL